MSREFECKLEATREAVQSLDTRRWLLSLQRGPMRRKKLTSTYFDTAGYDLLKRGMTLRIRHVGGERIQTNENGGRRQFSKRRMGKEN